MEPFAFNQHFTGVKTKWFQVLVSKEADRSKLTHLDMPYVKYKSLHLPTGPVF